MAKLVLGTNKTVVVPAVVRDMSPEHYLERIVDANGALQISSKWIDLTGALNVGNYALMGAYYGVAFSNNTTVDMSSLIVISGISACANMFQNTSGLTSVNLSGVKSISGQNACISMFQSSKLRTINLGNLKTISGNSSCNSMFYSCTALQSIDLPSLTTISSGCAQMFNNCSNMKSFKANKLNVITQKLSESYNQMFYGCLYLESVEFGGLTASTFSTKKDQLQSIFNNMAGSQAPNGCTVHFPSNFDPSDPNHTFDASTLGGYPTFGGNASYIHVAFDLPATE